jgi:hypothetical protein
MTNRSTNNTCSNIFVKWDHPVTIIAIVITMLCRCSSNSPPRWSGIQFMGWIPLGGMWHRAVWPTGVSLFGCWISAIPVLLSKRLLLTIIDTSLTMGAHLTGRDQLPSGTWLITCSPTWLWSDLGMWHLRAVLFRKSRWLVLQNPHSGAYVHWINAFERNRNIFGMNFMSL